VTADRDPMWPIRTRPVSPTNQAIDEHRAGQPRRSKSESADALADTISSFPQTRSSETEPRTMPRRRRAQKLLAERLGLRRREEGSVLEAAGKPPFVGPNGSAASLGVADLPIGAELAGIPARKRQPAKRCLSERETVARPRGRRWQRKARQQLLREPTVYRAHGLTL
jgi:hypothetical protein